MKALVALAVAAALLAPGSGALAQEESGGRCGQQAYEGWTPLSWVGGTVVGSAPQVKAMVNSNVSPDTDWDAAARIRSGEWQTTYRNAPLASMNTFRDAYTSLPFHLFVSNSNGTDYGNGC